MIERDRTGLHQQAQSGLIDEVLRDRMSDEREIAVRAHALGLRKTSRYFPVTVRVRYRPNGELTRWLVSAAMWRCSTRSRTP